jgi:hypothetical protein
MKVTFNKPKYAAIALAFDSSDESDKCINVNLRAEFDFTKQK